MVIVFAILFLKNRKANNSDIWEIGKLMFPGYEEGFSAFYSSFNKDYNKFVLENEDLLESYSDYSNEKIMAIELLYIFGESKNLISTIDWRGEENEREIEKFIDKQVKQPHTWSNTEILRKGFANKEIRDGEFIIDLFKTVDEDLKVTNYRLIFFDRGTDSYTYTVVYSTVFNQVISKLPNDFYGADKLKNDKTTTANKGLKM